MVLPPPPLLSPPGPGLLPAAVGSQGATYPLAAVAEELGGALKEPHKSPGGLDPLAPLWGIQGATAGSRATTARWLLSALHQPTSQERQSQLLGN